MQGNNLTLRATVTFENLEITAILTSYVYVQRGLEPLNMYNGGDWKYAEVN